MAWRDPSSGPGSMRIYVRKIADASSQSLRGLSLPGDLPTLCRNTIPIPESGNATRCGDRLAPALDHAGTGPGPGGPGHGAAGHAARAVSQPGVGPAPGRHRRAGPEGGAGRRAGRGSRLGRAGPPHPAFGRRRAHRACRPRSRKRTSSSAPASRRSSATRWRAARPCRRRARRPIPSPASRPARVA